VTDADRLIGAPAYLSPEMIRGVGDGVSADQYALGVLAYELLLWRLPFADDDAEALLDAQVHQPPPPPREIRPELSEAVEQVLLRQLAKKPDDRYPTATEFVGALRMALEDRPARLDAIR
jgi:serine/threonine-protein kinase